MLKIFACVMVPFVILFAGLSLQYSWAIPLAFMCIFMAIVFMQQNQWEEDREL